MTWVNLVIVAVIVLSLPIAAISVERAVRGDPRLSVEGSAVPGATVLVRGDGFDAGSQVQLTWNGDGDGMPVASVDGAGTFWASVSIPSTAPAGSHVLGAISYRGQLVAVASPTASIEVIIADRVAVTEPEVTPSPSPTPEFADTDPEEPEPARSTPAATPMPTPEPQTAAGGSDDATSDAPAATPAPAPPAPQPTPAPTPAPMAGAPPTSPDCAGYPEPRVWMEAQAWWLQTPGRDGTHFGHAHVGTCFPYGVAVAGTVVFDVKLTMFRNPGTFVRLRPHIATANGDSINYDQPELNWRPANGTGEMWQRVVIDTTRVPVDGLQELRMFAQIKEPDGKEMHVSTGWQLDLANGKPERHYRDQGLEFTEGRGWYTDVDYTVARFSSILPATVSGTWTFNVDLKPGAGGIPVTSHSVAVDPNHHQGNEGWVIRSGSGEYVGPISIDTRQLANGVHRLMLKADADASAGSTNSGILVLFFRVQN